MNTSTITDKKKKTDGLRVEQHGSTSIPSPFSSEHAMYYTIYPRTAIKKKSCMRRLSLSHPTLNPLSTLHIDIDICVYVGVGVLDCHSCIAECSVLRTKAEGNDARIARPRDHRAKHTRHAPRCTCDTIDANGRKQSFMCLCILCVLYIYIYPYLHAGGQVSYEAEKSRYITSGTTTPTVTIPTLVFDAWITLPGYAGMRVTGARIGELIE